MDARVSKRYAAMLFASAAGLSAALAGCGGPDAAPSGSTSSTSTSSAPEKATSALPETIDVNSATEVAALFGALGIEMPPIAPLESTRSGGASGIAYPTWPIGDVRKDALTKYRIESTEAYRDDGMLRFMKGTKVLYETPFRPGNMHTEEKIPAAVTESIKIGDTVNWGVYFASKKQKPLTASFTVVEKSQMAKAYAKLAGDHALGGTALDLARAQVAKNYGYYSEALSIYTGIVEKDGRFTSVYLPMLDCMRALKLKDTPLYDLAKSRMVPDLPARIRTRPSDAGASPSGPGGPTLRTDPPTFVPPPPTPPSTPPSTPPVAGGGVPAPTPPSGPTPAPSYVPPGSNGSPLPGVPPLPVKPPVIPALPPPGTPPPPPEPLVGGEGPAPTVPPEPTDGVGPAPLPTQPPPVPPAPPPAWPVPPAPVAPPTVPPDGPPAPLPDPLVPPAPTDGVGGAPLPTNPPDGPTPPVPPGPGPLPGQPPKPPVGPIVPVPPMPLPQPPVVPVPPLPPGQPSPIPEGQPVPPLPVPPLPPPPKPDPK